jgi:hypothetical protein
MGAAVSAARAEKQESPSSKMVAAVRAEKQEVTSGLAADAAKRVLKLFVAEENGNKREPPPAKQTVASSLPSKGFTALQGVNTKERTSVSDSTATATHKAAAVTASIVVNSRSGVVVSARSNVSVGCGTVSQNMSGQIRLGSFIAVKDTLPLDRSAVRDRPPLVSGREVAEAGKASRPTASVTQTSIHNTNSGAAVVGVEKAASKTDDQFVAADLSASRSAVSVGEGDLVAMETLPELFMSDDLPSPVAEEICF